MSILERREIAADINLHITNGVYMHNKKFEDRMQYIANKLFVVNGERLTKGELQTLKDEGYI